MLRVSPFFSQIQCAVGTQFCGALKTATKFRLPKRHESEWEKTEARTLGWWSMSTLLSALPDSGALTLFVAVR